MSDVDEYGRRESGENSWVTPLEPGGDNVIVFWRTARRSDERKDVLCEFRCNVHCYELRKARCSSCSLTKKGKQKRKWFKLTAWAVMFLPWLSSTLTESFIYGSRWKQVTCLRLMFVPLATLVEEAPGTSEQLQNKFGKLHALRGMVFCRPKTMLYITRSCLHKWKVYSSRIRIFCQLSSVTSFRFFICFGINFFSKSNHSKLRLRWRGPTVWRATGRRSE